MARRKKNSFRRWIMHFVLLLAVLGVLLFGLALGALCLAEAFPPPVGPDSDAIIVLGAQVYPNGQPSPQLALRLEAALEAYQQNPRLIIACGAQGANEPGPEAQIMRDWLKDHGVPADHLIAECESRNTRQNLEKARALLPHTAQRVTVVTSDYHLPRALALARDLGLEADGIGSPCLPEARFWIKNHTREVLAWGKYLAEKVLAPSSQDSPTTP